MNLLLKNTENECLKLLHRKKYVVFLIIEIFICVCFVLIQTAINRALQGEAMLQIANLSLVLLTFFIQVYIPLIIFMASCDLFSSEMHDNSIKAILMRPISRFKIYISKIAAITIFAIVYLISLFLVTNVLEAVTSGRILNFWTGLGAYLLDIIPLLALVLLSVLINQLSRGSSLAMFLCILVYVLLCIVGVVVPEASGLLFTGYLQWHNVWLGVTLPMGAMLSKIGLLLGYCLVFGCAGFYLFDKRDI